MLFAWGNNGEPGANKSVRRGFTYADNTECFDNNITSRFATLGIVHYPSANEEITEQYFPE